MRAQALQAMVVNNTQYTGRPANKKVSCFRPGTNSNKAAAHKNILHSKTFQLIYLYSY